MWAKTLLTIMMDVILLMGLKLGYVDGLETIGVK
jgi:hypothetical protein